jgi:hypothetical protein
MKDTQTRLMKILAMGLIAGLLLSTTVFGHNLVLLNTISPVGGSTITTTETTLSGTFWNSGCGLGATIEVSATDGSVAAVTQSCYDGTWSWSADWSGYGPGDQTVIVTFVTYHGGNDGHKFMHASTVTAVYHVVLACDLPDAPAIANHYMHNDLNIRDRSPYNTVIPAVAHAMNAGDFGQNACAPDYAEKVIAFVNALLGS